MSNEKVVLQLYRSLLRFGHRFDSNPSSKALFFRKSTYQHDDPKLGSLSRYYNKAINFIFNNEHAIFLSPSNLLADNTLRNIVRREFRLSNEECSISIIERIDLSFIILKKISSIWYSYENILSSRVFATAESTPHIPYRTLLPHQHISASITSTISPGTLLVAHPLLPGSLHRAVILILEHTAKGSHGIIINRSLDTTVASSIKNLPASFVNIFGKNQISFGGKERRFQVLHDVPDCGGLDIPMCSAPLYSGGNIIKLMEYCDKHGVDQRSRFHFYAGCCVWSSNDLEKEIESGCWIPVETTPNELLQLVWNAEANDINNISIADDNLPLDNFSTIIDDQSTVIDSFNDDKSNEQQYVGGHSSVGKGGKVKIWSMIMEELGPNFESFSQLPSWSDINSIESIDFK